MFQEKFAIQISKSSRTRCLCTATKVQLSVISVARCYSGWSDRDLNAKVRTFRTFFIIFLSIFKTESKCCFSERLTVLLTVQEKQGFDNSQNFHRVFGHVQVLKHGQVWSSFNYETSGPRKILLVLLDFSYDILRLATK